MRFRSKERGTRVKDYAENGAIKRVGRGWGRKEGNLPSPPLPPWKPQKIVFNFILSKIIYCKSFLNGKETTTTTFKDVPLLPQSRVPFDFSPGFPEKFVNGKQPTFEENYIWYGNFCIDGQHPIHVRWDPPHKIYGDKIIPVSALPSWRGTLGFLITQYRKKNWKVIEIHLKKQKLNTLNYHVLLIM